MGGSTGTGITSGLDRPGYKDAGTVQAALYPGLSSPDVIPVPVEPPILNIGLFNTLFILLIW